MHAAVYNVISVKETIRINVTSERGIYNTIKLSKKQQTSTVHNVVGTNKINEVLMTYFVRLIVV